MTRTGLLQAIKDEHIRKRKKEKNASLGMGRLVIVGLAYDYAVRATAEEAAVMVTTGDSADICWNEACSAHCSVPARHVLPGSAAARPLLTVTVSS